MRLSAKSPVRGQAAGVPGAHIGQAIGIEIV
jgi:hypothetical protein